MDNVLYYFFFFNDTATTEIYTLSLHDALPISCYAGSGRAERMHTGYRPGIHRKTNTGTVEWVRTFVVSLPKRTDRKSTRLNSSHANISYAVFCLKKKKKINPNICAISIYHCIH